MHLGDLAHVKVDQRCLITRHLQQFLGIAS
jgi:hypothetical protein